MKRIAPDTLRQASDVADHLAPNDPLAGDFRNFLFAVWQHLKLPDPTPVQYDIARYLQKGPKRRIIEAFRGVGKSWITSAYVLWRLYRDPQLKVLVVSASKDRADSFTTFTRRLIDDIEWLQFLAPSEGQRDSKIAFDVGPAAPAHAPSVKSVGIMGQLTGSRANLIVADDVEVPNNAETQVMRDKLSERVKEFDAVLSPGGEIVYLGTPQTEQSLYPQLENRGYKVRIWPARYPDDKLLDRYGHRLAPMILDAITRGAQAGTSTDPKRFSDEDLMEREASYGRSGFALQFMLDTTLSDQDRYPLKLSDLIVMDLAPDKAPRDLVWGRDPADVWQDVPNVGLNGDRLYRPAWWSKDQYDAYTGCVMSIDPSGRGKDETGYAVVKICNGRLFLAALGGLQGGYSPDTLAKLAHIAMKHQVKQIIVEPNFGDGMFSELLKPVLAKIYPCSIEDTERASTSKEARIIDTLEPIMNQHRLVVDRSVIEDDYKSTEHYGVEQAMRYRAFYQMTRITKDKGSLAKDDRLDALAMAVHYWIEAMAKHTADAVKESREQALRRELDDFLEHVLGTKPGNPSWIRQVTRH
jgi:hypothetical protein